MNPNFPKFKGLSQNGQAFNGGANHASWASLSQDNFFYRVYFTQAPVPQATTVNAGFTEGSGRGFVVDDSGNLTTNARLAVVAVVDDTASMAWSDPAGASAPPQPGEPDGRRRTAIPKILQTLWDRAPESMANFWIFSNTQSERSAGFTNDLSAIESYASALYAQGQNSILFETASIAISGLNPQALVDTVITSGAATISNAPAVQAVVNYLAANNILGLANLQAQFGPLPSASGWDGSQNTIQNYDDVSQAVVMQWAQSFTPVALVFADGDDVSGDPTQAATLAQSMWNDAGVNVYTFGLGTSHRESGLRTLSALTGGVQFDITNGNENTGDWDSATASFLHGGANTLFTSQWQNSFDFESPTWIRQFLANFTVSNLAGAGSNGIVNSACVVQVCWTTDRINWTPWQTLASGTPLIVNDLALGLKYQVTLADGWNGTAVLKPQITTLQHITVLPSQRFYVTPAQSISGMLFEYLLSAAMTLPPSARATWCLLRGDSTDLADGEAIRNNARGALPNRQQALQFTPQSVTTYPTTTVDNQVFQVVDSAGNPVVWAQSDTVQVTEDQVAIDPTQGTYSYDWAHGLIYFASAQVPNLTVTVTITVPEHLYVANGEPTTTQDRRTYTLANGRWISDATIIVLINGHIQRGGYWLSPDEGTVTFNKELDPDNIVTVYVEPSGVYRVGVLVDNYQTEDVAPATLDNFGLYFTVLNNQNLLAQYNLTSSPVISGVVTLNPSNGSVYERLWLDYKYASVDGNVESGTLTTWWRYRPGFSLPGGLDSTNSRVIAEDSTTHTYLRINDTTGLTTSAHTYDNRTLEFQSDVGALGLFREGDWAFVEVTPSDGFSYGTPVRSAVLMLAGTHPPRIDGLPYITGDGLTITSDLSYIPAGKALTAVYTFVAPDGGPDESIIYWYEHDRTSYEQGPYSTLTSDWTTYQVVASDGKTPLTWSSDASVQVYLNNAIVDINANPYNVNAILGQVTFRSPQAQTAVITIIVQTAYLASGPTIPAGQTQSKQVYNFIITPYDGIMQGNAVVSQDITILSTTHG